MPHQDDPFSRGALESDSTIFEDAFSRRFIDPMADFEAKQRKRYGAALDGLYDLDEQLGILSDELQKLAHWVGDLLRRQANEPDTTNQPLDQQVKQLEQRLECYKQKPDGWRPELAAVEIAMMQSALNDLYAQHPFYRPDNAAHDNDSEPQEN